MARQVVGAEAVWRERFKRFQSSGMTVKAFCEREGVSAWNFHAWKRRLGLASGRSRSRRKPASRPKARSRREAAGQPEEKPLFVPVTIEPVASVSEVRIELPGGAVVHVPSGADERLVALCIRSAIVAARLGEDASC